MTLEIDGGVLSLINEVLCIEGAGFPQEVALPEEIDLSALWRAIAPSEADPHRCPFDREIFWGLDPTHGELVVTETTVGEKFGVTPQSHHLIGVHTHPRPKSRSPFVVDDEVEVAPTEMAYFLDNPDQYAELVFNRSLGRREYPSTLVLKTEETQGVRYGDHEPMKQELHLHILLHEPFWRRERAFHKECDRLVREKHIALYRGAIVPDLIDQPFLTLVR